MKYYRAQDNDKEERSISVRLFRFFVVVVVFSLGWNLVHKKITCRLAWHWVERHSCQISCRMPAALKTQVKTSVFHLPTKCRVKSRVAWDRSDKTRDFLSYNTVFPWTSALNINFKFRLFDFSKSTNLHWLIIAIVPGNERWVNSMLSYLWHYFLTNAPI